MSKKVDANRIPKETVPYCSLKRGVVEARQPKGALQPLKRVLDEETTRGVEKRLVALYYHVARAGKCSEEKNRLSGISLYPYNDLNGFDFSYFG